MQEGKQMNDDGWCLCLDSTVSQPLVFNALDAGDGVPTVGMANPRRLTAECDRSADHMGVRGRRRAMRPRGQSAGGGRLALVPAAAAEDTEQRVAERLPEVFVEVGVDKRVQRRVEVTDPEEYLHDDIGTVARFAAERD